MEYWFRSYSEALLSNSHKSTQKGLAPSYGLRCAQVPSLRSCSVGTPSRAIHGPSRLSRHPCRSTHSTEPPLGLPGGQPDQKHCAPRRPTGRPVAVSVCCTISVAADEERRLRSSAATTRPRLAYGLKCKRHLKGAFAESHGGPGSRSACLANPRGLGHMPAS